MRQGTHRPIRKRDLRSCKGVSQVIWQAIPQNTVMSTTPLREESTWITKMSNDSLVRLSTTTMSPFAWNWTCKKTKEAPTKSLSFQGQRMKARCHLRATRQPAFTDASQSKSLMNAIKVRKNSMPKHLSRWKAPSWMTRAAVQKKTL